MAAEQKRCPETKCLLCGTISYHCLPTSRHPVPRQQCLTGVFRPVIQYLILPGYKGTEERLRHSCTHPSLHNREGTMRHLNSRVQKREVTMHCLNSRVQKREVTMYCLKSRVLQREE
jgi:hypothetical protein